MNTTASPICTKCQGEMRSHERNGMLVDPCHVCRGIFLDRGELERLLDAEDARDGASEITTAARSGIWQREHDDGHRKRHRRSWFEDLLGD